MPESCLRFSGRLSGEPQTTLLVCILGSQTTGVTSEWRLELQTTRKTTNFDRTKPHTTCAVCSCGFAARDQQAVTALAATVLRIGFLAAKTKCRQELLSVP